MRTSVTRGRLWFSICWRAFYAAHRVVKIAVEEFIELSAYFLWLIGTIEYTYQAAAIAHREPQPAAARRRERRKPKSEGRF